MTKKTNQSKSIELRKALLKKWVIPLKVDQKRESIAYDISSLKDKELQKEEEIFKNFMDDDFF